MFMSSCILSQETMEDVYIHHMPHLCGHILHSLTSQEPLAIKPRSLQHCLELLLFATAKIVQEASLCSSPATTTTAGTLHTVLLLLLYLYVYVLSSYPYSSVPRATGRVSPRQPCRQTKVETSHTVLCLLLEIHQFLHAVRQPELRRATNWGCGWVWTEAGRQCGEVFCERVSPHVFPGPDASLSISTD